jgi:hypothetical protein
MASDKKKQLLFGGIGVVALVIAVAILMKSGASDVTPQTGQPNQPVVGATDSDFDDDPASVASRSTPTVDRSGSGRLAGASDGGSAIDEEEEGNSVAKKSKRQKKRRSRKKQSSDDSDDEEATKKAGKQKMIPRPF